MNYYLICRKCEGCFLTLTMAFGENKCFWKKNFSSSAFPFHIKNELWSMFIDFFRLAQCEIIALIFTNGLHSINVMIILSHFEG